MTRIPVAYLIVGLENNRKAVEDFFKNPISSVSLVIDGNHIEMTSKNTWLWKEICSARTRGVRVRSITEVTPENLEECKQDMARLDEMRHLAGVLSVFGVSDVEFIALAPRPLSTNPKETIQSIQSNSETIVAFKQLIFDTLWSRATPALARIRELEGKSNSHNPSELVRDIIDRVYSCMDCNATFIFAHEVHAHREGAGHERFREYPLV
ncbi:MAG: hypothetical protein ABI361_11520 [Nitrososphaera sp.]